MQKVMGKTIKYVPAEAKRSETGAYFAVTFLKPKRCNFSIWPVLSTSIFNAESTDLKNGTIGAVCRKLWAKQ